MLFRPFLINKNFCKAEKSFLTFVCLFLCVVMAGAVVKGATDMWKVAFWGQIQVAFRRETSVSRICFPSSEE